MAESRAWKSCEILKGWRSVSPHGVSCIFVGVKLFRAGRRHNKMGVRWCSPGSSRRHSLSIENPNSPPYLATAYVHGDAFLSSCVRTWFGSMVCVSRACVACGATGVIFFGRRHVRANIAAYAYLYGIKNHPSLKMHRLLHTRRAESSPSRVAWNVGSWY